jgi:hypothetical protein
MNLAKLQNTVNIQESIELLCTNSKLSKIEIKEAITLTTETKKTT